MAAKKTIKKPAKKAARSAKTASVTKTRKSSAKAKTKAKRPARPKARGRSEGLGHTLVRAVTVAILSDGEIGTTEEKLLARYLEAPVFKGLDVASIAEATIRECVDRGPEAIYADIASKLKTKEEREAAFSSCLAATASDGKVTASEARMLHALKDAFSLSTARARSLAGPAAAIFR